MTFKSLSGRSPPMSKLLAYCCVSLCAISIAVADSPGELSSEITPEFPMLESIQAESKVSAQSALSEILPALEVIPAAAPVVDQKVAVKAQEVNVEPFTGKIKGRKVRMRLKADLDSRVMKELSKGELVKVVGEKGDFWAVEAPQETDAYVFRSFVLDGTVEGSHVNVRLEPSTDAPILTHLNSGDHIENASVSPINSKWLKIALPAHTRFYVAKDYVEYAGGPEVKERLEKRRHTAEQLLEASAVLGKAELRKPFEEIDFDRVAKGYRSVIDDFSELSELVDQAKESLASFQEEYLQKKISHLDQEAVATTRRPGNSLETAGDAMTDKMRLWEPLEEALYSSWSTLNDNKSRQDYYEEQTLASVEISGIVEPYVTPAKNRPGDFIVRDKDLPVAYIYSTKVNLQNLVGKQVKLVGVPRPNNNFAFPAYYVIAAE
jgi:hypothetical protein